MDGGSRAGIEAHNFFFSSRRRHTRSKRDWSSDVCSSDLFVADHVLEEFLLALDGVIARPQERAGLVESLAHLVGGDLLVADLGDDRSGLLALVASGEGERGTENAGKAGIHAAYPS